MAEVDRAWVEALAAMDRAEALTNVRELGRRLFRRQRGRAPSGRAEEREALHLANDAIEAALTAPPVTQNGHAAPPLPTQTAQAVAGLGTNRPLTRGEMRRIWDAEEANFDDRRL